MSRRTRGRAPNSVNVIAFDAGEGHARCSVEQWDYVADADRFERVLDTPILLDRPIARA